MGKYSGCLTIKDVCRLECIEATKVLEHYGVPKKVIRHITAMIEEAYYQLRMSCSNSRAMETIMRKRGFEEEEFFKEYIEESNKECFKDYEKASRKNDADYDMGEDYYKAIIENIEYEEYGDGEELAE